MNIKERKKNVVPTQEDQTMSQLDDEITTTKFKEKLNLCKSHLLR